MFGVSRGPGLEFVVCSKCGFNCLLNHCSESLQEPESHFLGRGATFSASAIVPFVNWAAPAETRTKKWKYQILPWGQRALYVYSHGLSGLVGSIRNFVRQL